MATKKETGMFRKDFLELMKVARGLDRAYGSDKKDTLEDLKKFRKVISDFNRKYKGISLKIPKDKISVKPLIFIIGEKSVRDIYNNAISRMQGISAIGSSPSSMANISQQESFFNELEQVKNILYVQFKPEGAPSAAFFFESGKKEKPIRLDCDIESALNENSIECQVIMHYALKGSIDDKIDLHSLLLKFSFTDLSKKAMKHFLEKFNPSIEE